MSMKKFALLVGLLMLTGCQSTSTPEWVLNPTPETNHSFIAVGHGMSLTSAKNMAMAQINARLWTQVESSGYERQVWREYNGTGTSQEEGRTQTTTKTAPVVLVGMEYPKTVQSDGIYYVEAMIDRSNIKTQLEKELINIEQDAQMALANKQHTDPLVWWLANRDITALKEKYISRQAMLMAVSQEAPTVKAASNLTKLERELEQTKSQLRFFINAKANDKQMKGFIADHLSQEHVATVNQSQQASHQLVVKTNWRQSKVGDAFISTVITRLTIKNSKGQSIASSELIASGNSVSNYTMSKEGASRHFSAQLSDLGIWHSLGVL